MIVRVVKIADKHANPSVPAWRALAAEKGWRVVDLGQHIEIHAG